MKYKIAIFDLDGTILNTLDDLADSLNVVLQKFQMPLHTYEQVRFMVGNGIPKLIERALRALVSSIAVFIVILTNIAIIPVIITSTLIFYV